MDKTSAKKPVAMVKLPSEAELMKSVASIIDRECKCVKIINRKVVVEAVSNMAGKWTDEHLIWEIRQLITSVGNTNEDKCHLYIFIVELIRKALYPKSEETKKEAKKCSKELRAAEDFIEKLDQAIVFSI